MTHHAFNILPNPMTRWQLLPLSASQQLPSVILSSCLSFWHCILLVLFLSLGPSCSSFIVTSSVCSIIVSMSQKMSIYQQVLSFTSTATMTINPLDSCQLSSSFHLCLPKSQLLGKTLSCLDHQLFSLLQWHLHLMSSQLRALIL
jgi:hypothetical protein